MTPNLGQGACQAIEDAVVLAHELNGATDIVTALRSYEQKRAPRTAYISSLSRKLGKMAQMQNPLACWSRNMFLRMLPLSMQLKQMDKVISFEEEGKAA